MWKVRTLLGAMGAGAVLVAPVRADEVELTAPFPDAGDQLGIAVDRDGDTVVAGSWKSDPAGVVDQGVVRVFVEQAGTWTAEAELAASDGTAGDRFGYSVAVSGDVLAVGVPHDDRNGASSGSVYVFARAAGVWTEAARLEPAGAQADDRFGWSVDLDGDTLAVGCPGEDTAADGAGAVYVYRRSGTVWNLEDQLVANNAQAGDRLGSSVVVDGDTLASGAIAADLTAFLIDTGTAYVFQRSGGVWNQETQVFATNPVSGAIFGAAVDLEGERLVVGAHTEDPLVLPTGAAYVYTHEPPFWTAEQRLVAGDADHADFFGFDVSLSGDRIAIAAFAEDTTAPNAGKAYVFRLEGGTWTEELRVQSTDAQQSDNFASSLQLDGTQLVAGAPGDRGPQDVMQAGAVYVIHVGGGPGQALCFGDGSGAACPCGNESATPGEGCVHSAGHGMTILGAGTASVALDDLVVTAMGCPPNNNGIFYSGTVSLDPGSGLFDGLQCAGGDVRRFQPRSQTDGVVSDAGFGAQDPSGVYFSAGVTYFFQYWTRDVFGGVSPCGSGANFSPAYGVVMGP